MLTNSFLFLDRIGKQTEQTLWEQGVTDWDAYKSADTIPRVSDTKKQEHNTFLHKAEKNLHKENSAFFDHTFPQSEQWRLYREFQDSVAYLDIETTGLDQHRNNITTISIYDGQNAQTFVQGKDLTQKRLKKEISRHSLLVTFNGKRFDIPFIKEKFDIRFDMPHVDLMYAYKKLGFSGGLKSIEKQVGLNRDEVDDIDGKEAIKLWNRYQRGDSDALSTLVTYNQQDTINLQPLMEKAYNQLTNQTFTPAKD